MENKLTQITENGPLKLDLGHDVMVIKFLDRFGDEHQIKVGIDSCSSASSPFNITFPLLETICAAIWPKIAEFCNTPFSQRHILGHQVTYYKRRYTGGFDMVLESEPRRYFEPFKTHRND